MSDALLKAGVAQLLADADVAAWSDTGRYDADQVGIYDQRLPSSSASGLALNAYGVSDDPTLSDSVTAIQVLGRTAGEDPRTTDNLLDAVFDRLQGLGDITLSTGIRVVFCRRQSSLSLGQDDLKQWTRSDNYYLTIWRPSLNRT